MALRMDISGPAALSAAGAGTASYGTGRALAAANERRGA
ncbi:MAG: hypothetical protein JWR60_3552 [Polaromonas sp.]|nr:hypothetical protein [Polaromonas sp.]